eukprot:TRINITY_DN4945_c0_g1_i3.p1 TRINITY_DN4945_c0_g1~~TRINITY_DN4945_c0_g1_i3.p1  ORF type:complete len:275 (+),score=20.64 TRINITY_DN4945_c0_g1_i3:50-874(+)
MLSPIGADIHYRKVGHQSQRLPAEENIFKDYGSIYKEILSPLQEKGKKHFYVPETDIQPHKPGRKLFSDKYKETTEPEIHGGVRRIKFIPTLERGRPERLHLQGPLSGYLREESPKGIRVHPTKITAPSQSEVALEKLLGMKHSVETIFQKRNDVPFCSPGDKSYKSVQYSPEFFRGEGLVVGSTNRIRKTTNHSRLEPIITLSLPRLHKKTLSWNEVLSLESIKEDEKTVQGLNQWEQTILKEARPDWRDPDQVELEPPAKKNVVVAKKGVAK